MAQGTVSHDRQVGTLSGKSGYTAYEYAVRKIGNAVHVKGYISKASGGFGTSQVTIGDITNVPPPPQTTRFVCATGVHAYDATTCAYGAVDTSGNILILTPTGTHATAVLNFWYPV